MSRAIVLLLAGLLCTACGAKTFSEELGKLGYQRFQPPRKNIEAGTLVVLEKLPEGAVAVHPVCWRDQAFPGLTEAEPDPTASQAMKKKVEKTFKLEAEYVKQIKANVKYSQVEDISLTLQNVSVPEYSDADLLGKIGNRTANCAAAVRRRVEGKGQTVYTVLSVLRADVIYAVKGKSDIGGGAGLPPEVLEGLKLDLGGSVSSTTDQTIRGNALHWGLKPDVFNVAPPASGLGLVRVTEDALSPEARRELIIAPAALAADKSDADLL